MLDKDMSIGVLDSGVGGLSVLKCLKTMLPHENFIYLGDTARTPYGPRKEDEVRRFVEQMLCFFDTQKVKLVVIACNTLTVLGVESLKKAHAFEIVGMSKGAKLVARASKNKKIAVIATEFTIGTGAHKKAILEQDPEEEVFPLACPKLVPLIEGEMFDTKELKQAVEEYTEKLRESGADTVILSCTHYPFIKGKLESALGSAVNVIDPAEETAKIAEHHLEMHKLLKKEGEGIVKVCFTADIERGKRLTKVMLEDVPCVFEEIKLK